MRLSRALLAGLSGILGAALLAGTALACAPVAGGDVVDTSPAVCGAQPFAEVENEARPRLTLEVVQTPDDRARGLMFRQSLPWDEGMLFIFEQETRGGFWMRNTLIPLSIAWLDRDGVVVDIQDMQPQSDDSHAPPAPYLYAIETNQGWFAANGVTPGQRVRLCLGDGTQANP